MIRRDLIVDILISLHDKKISKTEFLAELHDAVGMLRAGSYQSASEVEKAKEIASSADLVEKREIICDHLEIALDMFDKEFELRKK
jgi:hypothetical protein